MTQEERDKDMIESIEMWLHEIEPKWVEKELAWLEELRTRLAKEPVSDCHDLEEAANNHIRKVADAAGHPGWDWTTQDIVDAFIAGAEWQEKRFEKNRLAACDNQSEEEYERETDFVDTIIEKEHRIPTFSDAINYGIEWQKAKMMEGAEECELYWDGDFLAIDLNMQVLGYSERDKVKIIIVKED